MQKTTEKKWGNGIKKSFALWITIISGTITLANLLYSIVSSSAVGTLEFPDTFGSEWPVRWSIFLALEACLGYMFGKSLVSIQKYGHGMPYIGLVVISIISAWISLFNVYWLISGPPDAGQWGFLEQSAMKFFVGYVVAALIALYLIWHHAENSLDENNKLSFCVQLAVFLVIATGSLLRI